MAWKKERKTYYMVENEKGEKTEEMSRKDSTEYRKKVKKETPEAKTRLIRCEIITCLSDWK